MNGIYEATEHGVAVKNVVLADMAAFFLATGDGSLSLVERLNGRAGFPSSFVRSSGAL